MPFFSIVIPLYNKEKFVENTIKSILGQTFGDYEIIIVEDCSTDKSAEIVSKIISDKIRIIQHEKNKGLSASRNTGIKNANAGYIAFLDADDRWKPDYLGKIHSLIQKFPEAGLFATNYEEVYPNNIVILPSVSLKNFDSDGIVDDFFESNLGQPIYCSCCLCVSKSVFETIGYFNEKITFGEDVDFNIRANSAFKLAYSTEALGIYDIISENQITAARLSNKVITDFDAYEGIAAKNQSLKRYLDFNRYIMAKFYKMEEEWESFHKMKRNLNNRNLNYKQLFLLNCPRPVLIMLTRLKRLLIRKGMRITTFD